MSAAHANVIRDGARQSIPATEVVPGDIILIEEGDTIPADARLIQSTALQTAEAALTGESLPVSKDTCPIHGRGRTRRPPQHDLQRHGGDLRARARRGHGNGNADPDGTHRRNAERSSDRDHAAAKGTRPRRQTAGIIVVVIAVVMIATIILVEDVSGFSAIFDVLILGVALAVAAVPEGLPAVVTAVLSLGVQRMAKRNAIVRHLAAVETLGSANVIASDKTGTLTKNEMTVRVGRHRERARQFRRHGLRARRRGAAGRRWSRLMAPSGSSSCVRSPPPTAPTTPCCRSATDAGQCRATRPKAR